MILILSEWFNTPNYILRCKNICNKFIELGHNCHNFVYKDVKNNKVDFSIYDFIFLSKFKFDFQKIKLKSSEQYYNSTLSIPIFHKFDRKKQNKVIKNIKSFIINKKI